MGLKVNHQKIKIIIKDYQRIQKREKETKKKYYKWGKER